MSQAVQSLQNNFEAFQEEYAAFTEKNYKAAGTRARKALSEIGKLTKEIRKEIQDAKNEM